MGLKPLPTLKSANLRLGIGPNLAQFLLLIGINALVGAMIGQERTVLPLLAGEEFDLSGYSVALTFVLAFGLVKAGTNLVAGVLSDRLGRKPVLVTGWLIGLPVPLMLMVAPNWGWVVAANVLLGVNQGLTWSTTVIMKIDLAGPRRRGLALGLNEAAGYVALAVTALLTGLVAARYGLRPEPFYLGLAVAGLGLGLSASLVRETKGHARHEAAAEANTGLPTRTLGSRAAFLETSWRNRSLSAVSQAGLVNNLNDGMAWGLLPIFFGSAGLAVSRIGILTAIYPAVWGLGQLFTGALSDRLGRKWMIVGGMWLQAGAILLIAVGSSFDTWLVASVMLGAGTAVVYPVLLAAVGDVAHPTWRASAVGVYRFWRDAGFAVGALVTGILADRGGPVTSILVVGALTAASGVVVAWRMSETHTKTAGVLLQVPPTDRATPERSRK